MVTTKEKSLSYWYNELFETAKELIHHWDTDVVWLSESIQELRRITEQITRWETNGDE